MKNSLLRIIAGSIAFLAAILLNSEYKLLAVMLYIASYVVTGYDVIIKAFKNIVKGNVFDENFLMSIATLGAILIGEYPEAVAVMLFYQIGELFQSYAVDRSRKSIVDLMDIRPEYANIRRDGALVRIDPDEVQVGDIMVIKAGERIPLDGRIIEGNSTVDTSALTGESVPREVTAGSEILSGCININGAITAVVTKEYGESTVSRILDLVENAVSKKSKSEQFITRFARYYTPIVVITAVLLAIVPPLVFDDATFSQWGYRALTFLVVSCPCALVVSIPLSFFGGIGGASRAGILVKGSNYMEALARTETVVFDKTGTLTKGVFDVHDIYARDMSGDELLELAAYAEYFSNHPISLSIKRAYGGEIDSDRIMEANEISGHGIYANIDGKIVLAGNAKLMEKENITFRMPDFPGTVVHIAVDGVYAGYIVISDELKPDAYKAVEDLKKIGIKQAIMLTGDMKAVGEKTANDLGLDKAYCELLPTDKVAKLEELLNEKSPKNMLAYVGDGINDAPVLARADVGIAMGGLGSDAAIEAADVVIMNDEPSKITDAIKISKRTIAIANQNAFFAIGIKILILIFSAFGYASMWVAVFGDVGVTVLAIINSLRTLRTKNL